MKSVMMKAAIASSITIGATFAGVAEAQVSFTNVDSTWSNSQCSSFFCNVDENVNILGFNSIQYGTTIDSVIGFRDDGPASAGFGEVFRIGTLGFFNTADFTNILETADLNLTLDFASPNGLLAGLDFVANVSQNGLAPDSLDITPWFDSLVTTDAAGQKYKVSVGFADVPIEVDFFQTETREVFAKVETIPEPALMLGLGAVVAGLLAQKRSRKETA